jgi:hypothetical protein
MYSTLLQQTRRAPMNVGIHVRRWFSRILICLATVPTVTLAQNDVATLQVGRLSFGNCPTISGYLGPQPSGPVLPLVGSYSPPGLIGGQTVVSLYDNVACGAQNATAVLSVAGFGFDPGSSWLTSVTCNGITQSSASATYMFSFLSGATWSFPKGFGLSSAPIGTNINCGIVHGPLPWL